MPDVLTRVSPAQAERVRLLLVYEGAVAGDAGACAAAVGRVYDKTHSHLAPLLGSAGVRALLVRSVKLRQGQFPCLDVAVVDSSKTLVECLQSQDAAVTTEAAEALFGTLFALITTFIGERLTTQALRRAWPAIEEIAPGATTPTGETDK
jgi:hypothetical protein